MPFMLTAATSLVAFGFAFLRPTIVVHCAEDASVPIPAITDSWRVPVVNAPGEEELVKRIAAEFVRQQLPAIPRVQPLAVGNTVMMRTPRGILGVDFRTGKRVWEFPWEEKHDEPFSRRPGIAQQRQLSLLLQRLWQDNPFGEVTTNGKNVFLLDQLGYAAMSTRPAPFIVRRDVAAPNPLGPTSTNTLVSIDLESHGKLDWVVGGRIGEDEPKLAGAFFLGPPIARGKQLFAIVERKNELELVVLDAKTGLLAWSVELEDVSKHPIVEDARRRLAGAAPVVNAAFIICPTASGRVIAISRMERSKSWEYEYKVDEVPRRPGIGRKPPVPPNPVGKCWAISKPVFADGRLLLTPADSNELHCIDLGSGRAAWPAQPRGENLFIAHAGGGKVVLVGKNGVSAIKLDDGKQAWTTDLGDGAMPSGRGFQSGDFYYLPTTKSEVLKIELRDGTIAGRVRTERPLGNLIQHDGRIISHGTDYVSVYRDLGGLLRGGRR